MPSPNGRTKIVEIASGSAYSEAAALELKTRYTYTATYTATTSYVDAGNCYKNSDPQEAINCFSKAIELYTNRGSFSIAAMYLVTIAEIYENKILDIEKAIAYYEQAGDYYRGEELNGFARMYLLKAAQYCAQLEKYERAIEIFEKVGAFSLESSRLKYAAKEYFFRAALCHMCIDFLNTQHALNKYQEMSPSFSDSGECRLIKVLLDKLEERDVDGFTDAVKEYNSISPLGQWYTIILLRITKRAQEVPDLH